MRRCTPRSPSKRAASLALWACALCVSPPIAAHAEIDRSVLLELSASVLKIEVTRVQGGYSLGSGVVVGQDRIATNCHVTRDATKIAVLRGGVRWEVTGQLSNVERDLCLLRVPHLQASTVTLGRAERLVPGQPVAALGFTGGMGMQSSSGEVLALHRFDGGRVIQSSNWFSSGASGGGLFDEKLQLVGILTFRLRGGEAHYFAAPAEWLQPMLDVPADTGYAPVAPERSQRLAYWQRPLTDQPRFLKAELLQRDDQWPELHTLAAEWARADAGDAEPWYLLGVALSNLNRLPEARDALGCSLAIDPATTRARARRTASARRGAPADRDTPPPETGALASADTAAAAPPIAATHDAESCSSTAPLLRTP